MGRVVTCCVLPPWNFVSNTIYCIPVVFGFGCIGFAILAVPDSRGIFVPPLFTGSFRDSISSEMKQHDRYCKSKCSIDSHRIVASLQCNR